MNKKLIKYIFVIILFFTIVFFISKGEPHTVVVEGGVTEEQINSIQPWYANINDYLGNYSYGFSETESKLTIKYYNNSLNALIKSGKFNEDGTEWIVSNTTLSNLRIKGNKFYSDQWNGEFVSFILNNKKEYGLKLYGYIKSKPSEPLMDEIGFHSLVGLETNKTPEERQKYINSLKANPNLTVSDIDDLRDVLGQTEFMQMFNTARNYVVNKSVSVMKYDLIFQWKKGDWIKFKVISENVITDDMELYMQKVNRKWIGYGVGTSFPDLHKQHPELFK